MSDLKKGDVFVNDEVREPELENFKIFIDTNNGLYAYQNLIECGSIEYIKSGNCLENFKVKRFLRE